MALSHHEGGWHGFKGGTQRPAFASTHFASRAATERAGDAELMAWVQNPFRLYIGPELEIDEINEANCVFVILFVICPQMVTPTYMVGSAD